MRTLIIVGKQGCGKTTLAHAFLKTYARRSERIIRNDRATSLTLLRSNQIIRELKEIARTKEAHTLFIDEADNWYSYLSNDDKKYFLAYWAVARHYNLNLAVFITRRYVQIPIQVRTSTDLCYITRGITGHDLKRVGTDRGHDLSVEDYSDFALPEYNFVGIE